MNWEDQGFVISKRKFRENSIILEVFTSKYGKVSGIVYGGTSRKIKNYLQLINKIFITYNSKGENKAGYFKTELINAISPKYFNQRNKILCLNALSAILRSVLPEQQPYEKIYKSLDNLLNNFNNTNWLLLYLNWEIELIKNLGFGFSFDPDKYKKLKKDSTVNIKVDNIDYKIPSFLIFTDLKNPNNIDIYNALCFSRNLMENKFFIPNNLRFPYSRKLLEEKFA
tara:strand:+ start:174 stop:851 length:678 start_codon:yes stop_codon:yes gene_type:complete